MFSNPQILYHKRKVLHLFVLLEFERKVGIFFSCRVLLVSNKIFPFHKLSQTPYVSRSDFYSDVSFTLLFIQTKTSGSSFWIVCVDMFVWILDRRESMTKDCSFVLFLPWSPLILFLFLTFTSTVLFVLTKTFPVTLYPNQTWFGYEVTLNVI